MSVEIFSLVGKIGTGKNYVAENILLPMLPEKNTVVLSFADHFKVDTINKDGLKYEEVFHDKTEKSRLALQKRGTEEGRNVYGADIWVNVLKTWIRILNERGVERVIIGDVRFTNEAEAIKKLGGYLIRINAPERNRKKLLQETKGNAETYDQISNHISETELDNYKKYDLVLNNDNNNNIFNEVRDFIKTMQLRNKSQLVIFMDLDDTVCKCDVYYNKQIKKLYNEVKVFKKSNITDEDFEVKFYQLLFNHKQDFFTEDKFSKNLQDVVRNIKHILKINNKEYENLLLKAFKLGYEVFDYYYEPIDNAVKTVKKLNKMYKVVFNTMGSYIQQKKKLSQLGLSSIDTNITLNKNEESYHKLMEKYPSYQYIAVGDLLHRDIIPSLKAGVDFAYWIGGNDEIAKSLDERIIVISKLDDIEEYLLNSFSL